MRNLTTGVLAAGMLCLSFDVRAAYALKSRESITLPVPYYQADSQLADFNGDSRKELVVLGTDAQLQSSVRIFSFSKTGYRESMLLDCSAAGLPCASLVVGDFTGDGNLDISYSGYDYASGLVKLGLLVGNGTGGFTNSVPSSINNTSCAGFTAADVNSDGFLDELAVCSGYPGGPLATYVLYGDGAGHLAEPSEVAPANGPFRVADWNRDGFPDLVMIRPAGQSNQLEVHINNRAGGFDLGPVFSYPNVGYFDYKFAVADFSGDGLLDIVASTVHYFLPNYSSQPELLLMTQAQGGGFGVSQVLPATTLPDYITSADLDNNGFADLVEDRNAIRYRLNSMGALAIDIANRRYAPLRNDMSIGDIDGDGCRDFAVYQNQVGPEIHRGDCDAKLSLSQRPELFVNQARLGTAVTLTNADSAGLTFSGVVRLTVTPIGSDALPSQVYTSEESQCVSMPSAPGSADFECLVESLGAKQDAFFRFFFWNGVPPEIRVDGTASTLDGVVRDTISRKISTK